MEMRETPPGIDKVENVLRWHAQQGNVFDENNDTVIVTRALLDQAANELIRLRAKLYAATGGVA